MRAVGRNRFVIIILLYPYFAYIWGKLPPVKRFGLLSLILVFSLSACTTILSINENKIEIPSSGLSTDIQLDVNKDWTASSSADWCRINPSSGDKNTKVIHVNVLQSTLYDYRECEITVY